jgi:glycosyltransferase involved in cell wall biosynthesis
MPCLNGAETLEVCVLKAQDFLGRSGMVGEVLIADNGSTDGSQEIARAAGARVVDVPERGYGSALITGISEAAGTFVIMGDADDSYDFSDLGAFVAALRGGADLVMGDRFARGISPGAMPPLHRYLGNAVLSYVGRLFLHSKIRDFHCGLRGFRRTSILRLDLQSTGMEFASEMVVTATLARLDIAEVPTTLRPDGRTRALHLRTWRGGWRHPRFPLLFSPRWLFLYPGIALMVVSFVVGVAVEVATVHIFSATLGVDTLVLASAGLIICLQSVLFAVFTKIYGVNEGFLPSNTLLDWMSRWLTLEIGLAVGGGLALLGVIGLVVAMAHWSDARFGRLDTVSALHTVAPSATLMTFGFQVTLASLFVGILAIGRVPPPDRPSCQLRARRRPSTTNGKRPSGWVRVGRHHPIRHDPATQGREETAVARSPTPPVAWPPGRSAIAAIWGPPPDPHRHPARSTP